MLSVSSSGKRQRVGHSAIYPSDVWETEGSSSGVGSVRAKEVVASRVSGQRGMARGVPVRSVGGRVQAAAIKVMAPLIGKDKKLPDRKMGGLSLPDVVRELLKERNILRWDQSEGVYEVMHGENFEARFNELRKVRNKSKSSGIERPFSRMYNFFVLESGDKWARTGTKFRPRNSKGMPCLEALSKTSTATREARRGQNVNSESPKTERNSISETSCMSKSEAAQTSARNEESEKEPCQRISGRGSKPQRKGASHGKRFKGNKAGKKAKSLASGLSDQSVEYSIFVREASPADLPFFPVSVEFASQLQAQGPEPAIILADEEGGYSHDVSNDHSEGLFETLILKAEDSLEEASKAPSLNRLFSSKLTATITVGDQAHAVHDITSPDASCHPSPEVGVLSLCGEFGGSPLDIGAPAVLLETASAAAAASSLMIGGECDVPMDSVLVASCQTTSFPPGNNGMSSFESLDAEGQWSCQAGICW